MVRLLPVCGILGGLSLIVGCAATTPRSLNSSQDHVAPPAVTAPASKARSTALDAQQKALERSTDPTTQTSPSSSQP
ncbi:hypothetical protein ACN4EK_08235 [Pantanalinema rosaneae CENA516]|uniref:hypothetical protein n=1 Tax=Pantanalinema rosaneae TaxID=1620701 RepID=UPI003D6E35AA